MIAKRKMAPLIAGGVLVGAACIAAYLVFFERANSELRMNRVQIDNAVFDVEIASTTIEQTRGLSFRESLAPGRGMLFLFTMPRIQTFWMKDMHFPLDIIWISGSKVVGFAQNAPPEAGTPLWKLKIYASPNGTDKVLEVNAGTVARENIKVGDVITFGSL